MMQKNKRKFWIWGGLGAVIVIFIAVHYLKPHGPQIVYQPIQVKLGNIKQQILDTGTIAPEDRLDLTPPVAGRIEHVLVHEGDKVRAGQVLAWMSSTERATMVDTARREGPAELKYWEDAFKMTPILAPTDGTIILKNSDDGQTVTTSTIVVSLSDYLIAKIDVDETDLSHIHDGQDVAIVLDAYPKLVIPSKVYHINYDATITNNVTDYVVWVKPTYQPKVMKSGMTANASFLVAEKKGIPVVPMIALVQGQAQPSVYIPNPSNGKPMLHPIEMGITDNKMVEIKGGLKVGDTVLIPSIGALQKSGSSAVNPFSPFHGHKK